MELVQQHMLHLERAKQAREYLVKCVMDSKSVCDGLQFRRSQPLIGPSVTHYSLDFAQQVKLLQCSGT